MIKGKFTLIYLMKLQYKKEILCLILKVNSRLEIKMTPFYYTGTALKYQVESQAHVDCGSVLIVP